jgi:hypothetical protein
VRARPRRDRRHPGFQGLRAGATPT